MIKDLGNLNCMYIYHFQMALSLAVLFVEKNIHKSKSLEVSQFLPIQMFHTCFRSMLRSINNAVIKLCLQWKNNKLVFISYISFSCLYIGCFFRREKMTLSLHFEFSLYTIFPTTMVWSFQINSIRYFW